MFQISYDILTHVKEVKSQHFAHATADVTSETKVVRDGPEADHQDQKHNDKEIWFDDCLIKVELSIEKQK